MAKIKCHYVDCVLLDEGYCSAALVEFDPDTGCATFSPSDAADGSGDDETAEWEEDELDEDDEEWLDEDEDEI
jgi:hypothetical protein